MSVHSHVAQIQSSSVPTPHKSTSKAALKTPRKRKRENGDIETLHEKYRSFSIKPHPSSVYDKPCALTPIKLIPRSNLSLSYLDPAPAITSAPTARLFSANIDLLEDETGSGKYFEKPLLLIARNDADNSLAAIERVQACVYALCRLARDVSIADLCHSRPLKKQRQDTVARGGTRAEQHGYWWSCAVVSTDLVKPQKAERIEKSQVRLPSDINKAVDNERQVAGHLETSQVQMSNPEFDGLPGPISLPTAAEMFQTLLNQYLEAVYLSRTSLAYFAKGPLSRVRAAFTSNGDHSMDLFELVAFLKTMILSQSNIDKKYRETLPGMTSSLSLTDLSDDAEPKAKKKTKPKKFGIGRGGVYSFEEDYVKRWMFTDVAEAADDSESLNLRQRLSELRVRETLAQIILILEILSLEASPSFRPPSFSTENNAALVIQNGPETKTKKRKSKATQDPTLLIDLHLDKLCIWQSVEQDDITTQKMKAGKPKGLPNDTGGDNSGGRLKEFCVEVIIPFYLSRTPECASMINRKLGAPSAPSPPKRNPSSANRKTTNGLPKGNSSKKNRRLSEQDKSDAAALAQNSKPALKRSSTDSSVVAFIKREPSEAPSVFAPQKTATTTCRTALSQYKRFSQREVDLNIGLPQANGKLRRNQSVQEELKNAICTLKKPNRGVAVREFVDSVDQRLQMNAVRLKKANSVSRKTAQSIQVIATPKRVRKSQDILGLNGRDIGITSGAVNDLPPSSINFVPSSTIKPGAGTVTSSAVQHTPVPRSNNVRGGFAVIEETPSRGVRRIVSFSNLDADGGTPITGDDGFVVSTPLANRHSITGTLNQTQAARRLFSTAKHVNHQAAVMETPVRPRSTGQIGVSSTSVSVTTRGCDAPLEMTRGGGSAADAQTHTETIEAGREPGDDSIYDALGWNDDVDDLA